VPSFSVSQVHTSHTLAGCGSWRLSITSTMSGVTSTLAAVPSPTLPPQVSQLPGSTAGWSRRRCRRRSAGSRERLGSFWAIQETTWGSASASQIQPAHCIALQPGGCPFTSWTISRSAIALRQRFRSILPHTRSERASRRAAGG
jgi:hypothetical protein